MKKDTKSISKNYVGIEFKHKSNNIRLYKIYCRKSNKYWINWEGDSEGTDYDIKSVEKNLSDGTWIMVKEPKADKDIVPYDYDLQKAATDYENTFTESDGTESVDFLAGAEYLKSKSYSNKEVTEMFNQFVLNFQNEFREIELGYLDFAKDRFLKNNLTK
jgi:hypothetical protein